MAASYKYFYFDIRGRGELSRLVFVAAGLKFDDVRVNQADWPGDYKAASPFGQLPYVEFNGQKFAQSVAIASYISKENGLYGESNLEALSIDGVVGLSNDYFQKWAAAYFSPDEEKKEGLLKKLQNEDLPNYLTCLEKILTDNGNGYYIGQKMSLADLCIYDILEISYRDTPDVYSKYPKVSENRKLIRSNPKLDAYLSERTVTDV